MPGPPFVEIWFVGLDAASAAVEEAAASLGLAPMVPEPAAAGHDAHRRTAHLALRLLVARSAGPGIAALPFEVSPAGKPFLPAAPGLQFSLAHTAGAALLALSDTHAVGVDLEAPRPIRIAPARRAAIEAAAVRAADGQPLPAETDPERRFLRAWVRLEAVAKCTGEGIGGVLTRLGARPGAMAPESSGVPLLDLTPAPGFVAAIAGHGVTRAAMPPDVRAFPADCDGLATLLAAVPRPA